MKIKKILSIVLVFCMVFCLLPNTVFAADSKSGTFTAVSMNVDGLPNSILGISINGDGPGSDGTKKISSKLNEMQWDIIAVSEDFNYNTELLSAMSNYESGTHRGGVSGLSNNTDGLNLLWKNTINVTGEKWTSWNTHYSTGIFGTGNGADGMIDKGYRYYQAEVAEGVNIDVYILHMDADSDAGDIAARESQLTQLADAIKASNNGNPIIVMGDTNCRYTRENMETLFIDVINADSRFTIRDTWVENVRSGVYPTYGADAIVAIDKGGSYEYPEAEIVDKIFYINNSDSDVTLTANSYTVATDFTDTDGTALADHWPVVVNFTYSVEQTEPEHTHSYTLSDEKAATCTDAGKKTYSCTCGDTYSETIDALGHEYVDGVCSRCGTKDPDYKETEVPSEDVVYNLGNAVTSITSGNKYALVFPSATNYSLNHNENGGLTAATFRLENNNEVSDDLVWALTEQDNGYTISAEINGATKYLARTKSMTNGGYKIALQDSPFVWTIKMNASTGSARVSTKVVSNNYSLRYYTAKTGWIVTNKGADIKIYEINE